MYISAIIRQRRIVTLIAVVALIASGLFLAPDKTYAAAKWSSGDNGFKYSAYKGLPASAGLKITDFKATKTVSKIAIPAKIDGNKVDWVNFSSSAKLTKVKKSFTLDISKIKYASVIAVNSIGGKEATHSVNAVKTGTNKYLNQLVIAQSTFPAIRLSGYKYLKNLTLGSSQLQNLDLSQNGYLFSVELQCPALTSLTLCANPQNNYGVVGIRTLKLNCPALSALDVSQQRDLYSLDIRGSGVASIDLTNNIALTEVYCDEGVTIIGYTGAISH